MKKTIDITNGQLPPTAGNDPRIYELPVEPVDLSGIDLQPVEKASLVKVAGTSPVLETIVSAGTVTASAIGSVLAFVLDALLFVVRILWIVVADFIFPVLLRNIGAVLVILIIVLAAVTLKVLLASPAVQVVVAAIVLAVLLVAGVASLPAPTRRPQESENGTATTIRAEVNIDTTQMRGTTNIETKINIK